MSQINYLLSLWICTSLIFFQAFDFIVDVEYRFLQVFDFFRRIFHSGTYNVFYSVAAGEIQFLISNEINTLYLTRRIMCRVINWIIHEIISLFSVFQLYFADHVAAVEVVFVPGFAAVFFFIELHFLFELIS